MINYTNLNKVKKIWKTHQAGFYLIKTKSREVKLHLRDRWLFHLTKIDELYNYNKYKNKSAKKYRNTLLESDDNDCNIKISKRDIKINKKIKLINVRMLWFLSLFNNELKITIDFFSNDFNEFKYILKNQEGVIFIKKNHVWLICKLVSDYLVPNSVINVTGEKQKNKKIKTKEKIIKIEYVQIAKT